MAVGLTDLDLDPEDRLARVEAVTREIPKPKPWEAYPVQQQRRDTAVMIRRALDKGVVGPLAPCPRGCGGTIHLTEHTPQGRYVKTAGYCDRCPWAWQ